MNPLPAEIIWNEPTLRFAEVPASKNSCTSLCNYCDFMHFYQLFLRWLVSAFVSEIYQITCNLLCIFQTWKYFFCVERWRCVTLVLAGRRFRSPFIVEKIADLGQTVTRSNLLIRRVSLYLLLIFMTYFERKVQPILTYLNNHR